MVTDLELLSRTHVQNCRVIWDSFTLTPDGEHWTTVEHSCGQSSGHDDAHECHCGSRWADR